MLKYSAGKRLIIDNNHHSNHGFLKGEVVRIVRKIDEGAKNEHYLAQSESRGETWYVTESELTNKCNTEPELKKYRILSVDGVDIDRGFHVGQIIEAELLDKKYGNVRVGGKYTLFGHQVELVQEGANTMDMKHDGYVVVNITDGVVSFNLTKEQAESEVDFYLKDDVDAENILVFPPNSNLPFSHGVKLID